MTFAKLFVHLIHSPDLTGEPLISRGSLIFTMKTATSCNIHFEVENEMRIKKGFDLTKAFLFYLLQLFLYISVHTHNSEL